MRVFRQTLAICLFNLQDLFTRLHLTGIGILGVAGMSLVLVGMLSMAEGFRSAFAAMAPRSG